MAASSLLAQDVTTAKVQAALNGLGAIPYAIGCGSRTLAGAQGRALLVLQTICVSVDAGGKWIGTPAPAPGIAGCTPDTNRNLWTCVTNLTPPQAGLCYCSADPKGSVT